MKEVRVAIAALEVLGLKYRSVADALDAAAEALGEVSETAEFHQERQEALEKARPFLSEETIKVLSGGPVVARRTKKMPWRPPRQEAAPVDEWGGG